MSNCSTHSSARTGFAFSLVSCWLVWLLSSLGPAAATSFLPECFPDRVVSAGESIQVEMLGPDGTAVVALEVPTPGPLMVEISSPAAAPAWVEVLPESCDGSGVTQGWLAVRSRSLGRHLLEVLEPGVVLLRIGGVDPVNGPDHISFVSGMPLTGIYDRDGEPGDGTEEADVEIQPLVSAAPCLHDRDGEPGDGTEEADVEIQPLVSAAPCLQDRDGEPGDGTEEADVEIQPFSGFTCGGEPADGLIWCANQLMVPGRAMGTIDGGREADLDYFTFHLEESRRIQLYTTGSTDTAGTLLDAQGRPLEFADDGGNGENFSLLASLSAGTYYVRVAGVLGAAGKYTLRIGEEGRDSRLSSR